MARHAAACWRTRPCWLLTLAVGELPMTAPDARQSQVLPRPACSPAANRAVPAANSDAAVRHSYDEGLDAAYEQAREHGDLMPLVEAVRRWWTEAPSGST